MSGSGRDALPDDREWSGGLGDIRECSQSPPECPRVVELPPGCPRVVGRPSQMSGSGRESIQDVR